MRYFIAAIATASALTVGAYAQPANADHDLVTLAHSYHDALHEVIETVDMRTRSAVYLNAYLTRLDCAADQFALALDHDPFCPRTQDLFEETRALHRRIAYLVEHGCRASQYRYRYCSVAWKAADSLFQCLEAEFVGCCETYHNNPPLAHPPRYNTRWQEGPVPMLTPPNERFSVDRRVPNPAQPYLVQPYPAQSHPVQPFETRAYEGRPYELQSRTSGHSPVELQPSVHIPRMGRVNSHNVAPTHSRPVNPRSSAGGDLIFQVISSLVR